MSYLNQTGGLARHAPRFLFFFALSACGDASGRAGCAQHIDQTLSADSSSTHSLVASDALDVLPVDSDLLVSFKQSELIALMESPWIRSVDRSLMALSEAQLLALCRDSASALGESLCAPHMHDALGIPSTGSLVVARYQDHWLWVFDSELSWQDPSTRPKTLPEAHLKVRSEVEHPELIHLSSKAHPDGAWMIHHKGLEVLVLPTAQSQDISSAKRIARQLPSLSSTQTWRALPAHRVLHDRLSERGELIVIGASASLVDQFVPRAELAARQHERFFSQIDRVGLGLWRSPTALNRLNGELRVSTKAGEAVLLRALEPSKSTLPKHLGGLLSEQTLGVMHAAVEPRSLLDMWRNALDMSQQDEFDKYLNYIKKDFLLDVDAALLDNLTGHLLLVIYGVQPGQEVDPSGASLFGLNATHEVLFAPIKDRFVLEQFFNALTQLSRGKLRRQRQDEVIQYVWIEEGELLGAVLLGDEAMAIVDSAVSVTHAMAQLTDPKPLTAAQSARYGAMLSTHQGFGFWMNPTAFSTRFTSDMSDMLNGMTHLSLTSYEQDAQSEQIDDHTLGAQMSMTLATEEFEEPVAGEP